LAKAASGNKRGSAGNSGCCLTLMFWVIIASLTFIIY
jgi:hypothetical protein